MRCRCVRLILREETVIQWGIVGPGGVSRDFRDGAEGSTSGRIVAVATRRPDNADLARDFPGVRICVGYEALLDDPSVQAVYIATPHPMHAQWAIRAAASGKHVLCEKPMGMSYVEVEGMFAAARVAGTFMAEGFMYRLSALTARIIDLVRGGAVGEVRMIRSSFGFPFLGPPPGHRLFTRELGGGAILDLGGYPASMCRLIAGCQQADGPLEPVSVVATAHIGPSGVDEWAAATLAFPNGIVAQLAVSISVCQENVLHIMGTTGRLEVDEFWFAGGKQGGTNVMRLIRPNGISEEIAVTGERNLYSFQFEAVNSAIYAGQRELSWPGMTEADSLGNTRVLDQWLSGAGVTYS
jgi:predicted dehydrogenase